MQGCPARERQRSAPFDAPGLLTFLIASVNLRKLTRFEDEQRMPEHLRTPVRRRERNHINLKSYKARIPEVRAMEEERERRGAGESAA